MDDDLFSPPGNEWLRLSPRYLVAKRISSLVSCLILISAAVIPLFLFTQPVWAYAAAGAGVLLIVWRQIRMGRWFRRWGYSEREEDLYVTSGLLWRTLTVVPYGRMQVVKVQSGPLERSFGLASVELVTASASTNARIPGLPRETAEGLRDRLSELGEQRSAGL